MAYVLPDGVFQVKCRQGGCPFRADLGISQTIMGTSEEDCESEAARIARNMAAIKHDATYGRTHTLADPLVRKVSGAYVPFGGEKPPATPDTGLPHPPGAVAVRRYTRGETILRKGDRAITVCEVLEGSARPEHTDILRYEVGRSFGAAGLLTNQARTGSVVADADGTLIAFYNIQELSKTNPPKARELYNEIMEDTLHVISWLDTRVQQLERKLKAKAAAKTVRKKSAAPKPKTRAKTKAPGR